MAEQYVDYWREPSKDVDERRNSTSTEESISNDIYRGEFLLAGQKDRERLEAQNFSMAIEMEYMSQELEKYKRNLPSAVCFTLNDLIPLQVQIDDLRTALRGEKKEVEKATNVINELRQELDQAKEAEEVAESTKVEMEAICQENFGLSRQIWELTSKNRVLGEEMEVMKEKVESLNRELSVEKESTKFVPTLEERMAKMQIIIHEQFEQVAKVENLLREQNERHERELESVAADNMRIRNLLKDARYESQSMRDNSMSNAHEMEECMISITHECKRLEFRQEVELASMFPEQFIMMTNECQSESTKKRKRVCAQKQAHFVSSPVQDEMEQDILPVTSPFVPVKRIESRSKVSSIFRKVKSAISYIMSIFSKKEEGEVDLEAQWDKKLPGRRLYKIK